MTPDGEGEAIKDKQGDAWVVALPTTDFNYYGSVAELKGEVYKRLKSLYQESISFKLV